jgi:hypothetical protein
VNFLRERVDQWLWMFTYNAHVSSPPETPETKHWFDFILFGAFVSKRNGFIETPHPKSTTVDFSV